MGVPVFPAYAGMSRVQALRTAERSCFPRLRGDEPVPRHTLSLVGAFSPPTRG